MTPEETKKKIESALLSFASGNLSENGLRLFETLGYITERQAPLDKPTFEEFEEAFVLDKIFREDKALVKDWKYVDLLFQLSKEEVLKQSSLFDTKKVDNTAIEAYLFFAIELSGQSYTRTELAQITREINRLFPMPAMILFKYNKSLTLSVINRRINSKDVSKDVLLKVTLIKDINIERPHRSHLEILFDLTFNELQNSFNFTNFVELHNAWQKTLDTKELNKRFYSELFNWYLWAIRSVKFPNNVNDNKDDTVYNSESVIRLLTRLIFVWFIKEKGLVPEKLFAKNEMKKVLKNFNPDSANTSTYYRAILQNLFFATLNTQMDKDVTEEEKRRFVNPLPKYNNPDYTDQTKYRYKDCFINPDEALKIFSIVPFFNGGLFECLDSKEIDPKTGKEIEIRYDGFSTYPEKQAFVPDKLFFAEEFILDLNAEYATKGKNYKVEGLINILDSYKFTITENTPLEEEIALDPELLGKVFENLLASYNPETQTTARKQTGSFYTPREIVNYMVDESLISYFKQKLNNTEETETKLRDLFSHTADLSEFSKTETDLFIKAISEARILDPACGSGAFPMGVLHRLVDLLNRLDPENKRWNDLQIQRAIDETAGVYREGNNSEERKLRLDEIEKAFDLSMNYPDYARKLFLIENCIYGVDIQQIAIQISKLRFFISLIVDQKVNDAKPNRNILSMPNLETKFVAANTLIGLDKPPQMTLMSGDVERFEKELASIRHKIFFTRKYSEKKALKRTEKNKREELQKALENSGYTKNVAGQMAGWNPFDPMQSAKFFDSETMFGFNDGFDIILGNPPYLRIQGVQEATPELIPYAKIHYLSAQKGNWDLYVLFTEAGYNMLRKNGLLVFIQPHKFFQGDFGVGIRNYIAKEKCLYQIVNFGAEQMFESATNYTCLFFIQKQIQKSFKYIKVDNPDKWLQNTASKQAFILPQPEKDQKWSFTSIEKQKILDKLHQQPQKLGDITRKIFVGLQTSADKIYVLKVKEWRKNTVVLHSVSLESDVEIENGLVKPFLMGKDVKRYEKPEPGNVVIFPYNIIKDKATLMSQEYIKVNFPLGWLYLLANRTVLEKRENGKMRHENFYAYIYPKNLAEFDAIKVITPEIASKPQLTLDSEGVCYHTTKVYSFVFKENIEENQAFWLGILNSQLLWFFLNSTGYVLRGGYFTFKTEYLKPFPIKRIDFKNKKEIALYNKVVDNVNTILKLKQNGKDTFRLEAEIDAITFILYGFTEDEMMSSLLQMPDVSESERREIQYNFKEYNR